MCLYSTRQSSNHKGARKDSKAPFRAQRWYHLKLEHMAGETEDSLGRDDLRLFTVVRAYVCVSMYYVWQ